MVLLARYRPLLLIGLLMLGVVGVECWVTRLPQFYQQPALPAAVSADLLLGLPILFYLGIVRRYHLSPLTLVGAFGMALLVAAWVLPPQEQEYMHWGQRVVLFAEPLFIFATVLKIGRIAQAYRQAKQLGGADFLSNLNSSLEAVLGPAGRLLAAELQMLRYGLLFWISLPPTPPTALPFPAYKHSAFRAICWTILLVSCIEMLVVHLLLVRWQPQTAWVILAISGYGTLFLLAHLQAVIHRATTMTATQVQLRVGFVWQLDLPLDQVQEVYVLPAAARLRPDTLNLAKLLFTEPNVLLACHQPTVVTGLYGWQRTAQRLALYVDDPARFVAALHPYMSAATRPDSNAGCLSNSAQL